MEVPQKTKKSCYMIQKSPSWDKTIIWKDTCTSVFIAALFTIAKTWKQPKCPSTDEWIKKMYIHTYNGILLSHKKEWNNALCSYMDGPRDYHTKWSKSERERKTNTIWYYLYVESKIWHKWTYLRNRNRLRHREQTCGSKVEVG